MYQETNKTTKIVVDQTGRFPFAFHLPTEGAIDEATHIVHVCVLCLTYPGVFVRCGGGT